MASAFSLVARKIFGSKNEREIKRLRPDVDEINRLEPEISALSDDELRAKIAEWKAKISAIEEREQRDEAMLEILPQVFAVVREASKRTIGQRHFDVQLIGGMILHQGRIAEMKTGEGKTLVATLPAVLNALSGRGVHVVTVNDYLARRDSEWMGRIYNFLGLSVGVVVHGVTDQERKVAYRADITYGQNNEFGFDYLRDNMKFNLEDYVQREHNFAIVDEVDSILIDEARTPLIISGASEESTDTYYVVDRVDPAAQARRALHHRREDAHRGADRGRRDARRAAARRREPVRPAQHPAAASREPGTARAHAVQARRRLRGQGRRGDHRRRIHRAPDAGPALERRAASGGRGEGKRQDRVREPDPGDHHLSELLPHVQEARRA